jgi:hypothetical protein
MACAFTLAATRLHDRFNRRYPQTLRCGLSKYDLTTIKDRWYRNLRRLVAARTRLGGLRHEHWPATGNIVNPPARNRHSDGNGIDPFPAIR